MFKLHVIRLILHGWMCITHPIATFHDMQLQHVHMTTQSLIRNWHPALHALIMLFALDGLL